MFSSYVQPQSAQPLQQSAPEQQEEIGQFVTFPPPNLTNAMLIWRPVDQPPDTATVPSAPLREKKLILLAAPRDGVEQVAYDGFGRELETYVLGLHISNGHAVYQRKFQLTLRIVNKVKLENGRFRDLREDDPFENPTKLLVAQEPDKNYTIPRETFSDLQSAHRAMIQHVNIEISPGIVRTTPALLVTLAGNSQLAIELSMNHTTPGPGRVLIEAIYGDVRCLQEVRPVDSTMEQFTFTGQLVACKTIRKDMLPGGASFDHTISENPLKEISVMQYIRSQFPGDPGHRHIVQLRDALENSNYVFEIMTYYNGGDLLDRLPRVGFDADKAKNIFTQVMSGLHLMHRCGIANLDLSLENILTHDIDTDTPLVVLTDFGLAERVTHRSVTGFTRRGKKYYYAPEYFQALPALDVFKLDMWASGIVFLLLTSGREPYDTRAHWGHYMNEFHRFVHGGRLGSLVVRNPDTTESDREMQLSVRIGLDGMTAINAMLVVDPEFRNASIEDVFALPYFHA